MNTQEMDKKDDTDTHQVITQWLEQIDLILDPPSPNDEPDLPVEILPWLYLSSQAACTQYDRMVDELSVTHVMTMNAMHPTKSIELEWSFRSVGIDHTYVASYDREGYDMIHQHWKSTCKPILEQVRANNNNGNNNKVVVHCAAGQNRSGIIVAAALLELEGWPLLKVIQHLKEKRVRVLTNKSFRRQLCELAQEKGCTFNTD